MKIIKIFFFPFLCLVISLFFCVPELFRTEKGLHKSIETFKDSKIVEVKMLIRADKDYLIINTEEGNQYEVGKTYSKYFKKLNLNSNIGKKITFYTINQASKYPRKIEIENEMVYDLKTGNFWYYFILLSTPLLFYFSISKYRTVKK